MVTEVDCPFCGRRAEFSRRNPWRPFCAERCKTGDLGAWASDAYRVPGTVREDVASDLDDPGSPRTD